MAERDILERIDARMDRGNDLMSRVEEEMRLTREFHAAEVHDLREFMRQMIARVERTGREQWRELSRLNDELVRRGAEQREESRAHRSALLKVLDRMDRLDPPPASA